MLAITKYDDEAQSHLGTMLAHRHSDPVMMIMKIMIKKAFAVLGYQMKIMQTKWNHPKLAGMIYHM